MTIQKPGSKRKLVLQWSVKRPSLDDYFCYGVIFVYCYAMVTFITGVAILHLVGLELWLLLTSPVLFYLATVVILICYALTKYTWEHRPLRFEEVQSPDIREVYRHD